MTTQDTKVDWGEVSFSVCTKCGYTGPAGFLGWHKRPNGTECPYVARPAKQPTGWPPQPTPTNDVSERMEMGSITLTKDEADMLRKLLTAIGGCVGRTLGHLTVFVPADLVEEARKAVALLEPVDGDLLAMREDAKAAGWHDVRVEQFEAGLLDLWKRARGRALAEAGK